MLKKLSKGFVSCIVFMALMQRAGFSAFAQHPNAKLTDTAGKKGIPNDTDTARTDEPDQKNNAAGISTVLIAGDKNAFFDKVAHYTYIVKNPTDDPQTGTVSCQVTTETGKVLTSNSVKVDIAKKTTGTYTFDIPQSKPGFYKINFMVNVSDYDDTTLRVFGIRPGQIRSQYPKPADFEQFWADTKSQLATIPGNFKVTHMPEMDSKFRRVYSVEMQSFDNITIHAWMTLPVTPDKNKKFSVLLGLPGYQVDLYPIMGRDDDLAIITVDVRGQGRSRGIINTRKDEFIFFRCEDRNRYVMRGVIMDCVRAVDFIFSQSNLKHDNILATGGSMGGFLSIALASLDKRVTICSSQNPILCDIHNLQGEVKWPITSFEKYVVTKPGLTMDKVMKNMEYFDTKNFATNLTCSTIMGIGLLDPYAPPNNEYAAFNNIPGKKRILVFKDLGHEVTETYKNLEGRWLRDTFGLF